MAKMIMANPDNINTNLITQYGINFKIKDSNNKTTVSPIEAL